MHDSLELALWLAIPIISVSAYVKLMWFSSNPIPRSPAKILRAGIACFLIGLICLGVAWLVHQFFNDRSASEYFGLEFPRRPGRFVAMSFSLALLALLLVTHALVKAFNSRVRRS